jgi:hypothetical protein
MRSMKLQFIALSWPPTDTATPEPQSTLERKLESMKFTFQPPAWTWYAPYPLGFSRFAR